MVSIDFCESAAGASKSARIEGRARLLDVCDETRAPVRFGCRTARCTTCCFEVLEGAEALEPAADEEAEMLQRIGARAEVRLACQAVVRDFDGKLRLRWIGPDGSVTEVARRA